MQRLRHIYHRGTHAHPHLHRYIDLGESSDQENNGIDCNLPARSESFNIERLSDSSRAAIDRILEYTAVHGQAAPQSHDAWSTDSVTGPNHTDKATVLSLARMAANAYVPRPSDPGWQDVKGKFNHSEGIGWEMDGLRGHIYLDDRDSTVIIALKGTDMTIFDTNSTGDSDKENDNLFASCCCGEGTHNRWKQVCSCMTSAYTCNSTCVVQALHRKDRYYTAARDLYHNVTNRYAGHNVWLTGHSLGGAVSSLLGLTYRVPTITFEGYPDALAASRLGLPVPPGYKAGQRQPHLDLPIYHYGHTADPVFMGTCNTAFSTCSIAGYAMESSCHTGKRCQYDTVKDLGWHVNVRTHSILTVISDVLERYDETPACESDLDCVDCSNWKLFESNSSVPISSTSTSTTTSSTRTRTETCRTPGWWGCRDELITSSHTSSTTSSSFTSTCHTPGWFGCKDRTKSTGLSPSITVTKPVIASTTDLITGR